MHYELECQEWVAAKNSKSRFYTTEIFATMEETEKAVKVVTFANGRFDSFWCPKSQLKLTLNPDYVNGEEVDKDIITNSEATIESLIAFLKCKDWCEVMKVYKETMYFFS